MIKVLGHRVLVEVSKVEEKSEGGIILAAPKHLAQERQGKEKGKVIGIGSTAYKELGDGKPWVKLGDTVYFQRYGGIMLKDKEEDKDLRILNDEDILAIIE